jgi:radical SAM protein with 4Fe4S-binding SPASM domain
MPPPTPAVPALPTSLQVEVSGACNLRCRMCLVRYAPAIPRREGALAYEDFLALLDALPGLERLTLQGLGEPLLSPHLVAMVAEAAGRGIEVGFNTNGTLLTEDVARRLVEAGCGWLHVSLDGATAATYEDVRHGTRLAPRPGQFDRVVGNLRGLLRVRSELGAATPRVQLVFVAMRRNVAELPRLVALAGDLGVDEVWVQNLSHVFDDTDPAGAYSEIRSYAEEEALFEAGDRRLAARAFTTARAAADRNGVALRLPRMEAREPDPRGCAWPFEGAYVTHRGDVQPCCMVMGSDRALMGNVREQPFDLVWAAAPYREFRAALAGGEPPAVCRGCSQYRGLF